MEKTELLQKKLGNIRRGAFWFGIFRWIWLWGIIILLINCGQIAVALYKTGSLPVTTRPHWAIWRDISFICARSFFLGYIFQLMHDAFKSIDGLICEMGEIV